MKMSSVVRTSAAKLAAVAASLMILGVAPEASAQSVCSRYVCYRFGDVGAVVSQIQVALGLRPTGFYDAFTEQAVYTYQSRNNLVFVDGIAGPETLLNLGIATAGGGGGGIPVDPFDPFPTVPTIPPIDVATLPYAVVVPGGELRLLREVQTFAPSAFIRTDSSRGAFIQANSYRERSFAEGFANYLRGQGLDARVAYYP
ncbi:MAG: peptidoglycan-binding domain-containing protein [Thainema sp.]